MNQLEITLTAVLTLSALINIGLFIYTREVLAKLLAVSEEIGDLQDMIDSFLSHIKVVYEMEMFYGDQTLQHLLEHARDFSEQMNSFEWIYSLTDEDAPDQPETEEDQTEDDDPSTETN